MATYLQGVTDFIPDYQPFQPDYNFYANALQTKQTQYDSNWKQLNNLYGQLYSADLTHGDNIKKKDELLKQIDFNLKRVSGLDLSLEQNVNQAMQVFRPFYEDKYLIKDMAWTKNWGNTFNSANALRTSQDEKQQRQYWSTGIQGLELRKQMFRDSSIEETLNIRNAKYTPYVQAQQEYMDLATKLNVSKTETTPDASGMYMVTKKNGDIVLPTLQQLFKSEYAGRPDIQDMYRERAFVERMSYAYQNAEKFGNSKEAEKEYIRGKMDWLKGNASKENNTAQNNLETTQNLQGGLEKDIKNNKLNPHQNNYGKSLAELFNVESSIANNTKSLNNRLNNDQSTSTQQGYQDEGDNLELDRMKVDAGYASIFAQQDILAAADQYAKLNSSVTYKVNQIGLAGLKSKYRRQEIEIIKNDKIYQKFADNRLKMGYWGWNSDGTINKNPASQGFGVVTTGPGGQPGTVTGANGDHESFEKINKDVRERATLEASSSGVEHVMKIIQGGITQGKFTKAELSVLVRQFNPGNIIANEVLNSKGEKGTRNSVVEEWQKIFDNYNSNPNQFTLDNVNNENIFKVNRSLQIWSGKHIGDGLSVEYANDESILDLNQFEQNNIAMDIVQEDNYNLIKNTLIKDITEFTKIAANSNSQIEYNKERVDQAVDKLMYRYTISSKGEQGVFNEKANEIDAEVTGILGFTIAKNTNQPRDAKWYNYVMPWTNLFAGNREDVKATASWTKDVFDTSYESLVLDPGKEGQLKPFFISQMLDKSDKYNADQFGRATKRATLKVAPDVSTDPGTIATKSFIKTVLSQSWGVDKSKFRITTKGNIKPANVDDDPGIKQDIALDIVRQLGNRLSDTPGILPVFNIESSSISMENGDLGSMTLRPPRELLDELITGLGADVKSDVMNTLKDEIARNGITFIAPTNVWESNLLYSQQFPDATEIVLSNRPIEYNDPYGNGFYKIEKTAGAGDYLITGAAYELQQNGELLMVDMKDDIDNRSGKTIKSKEKIMMRTIKHMSVLNTNMFVRIMESGNEELIAKTIKSFSAVSDNPFWNN